jgi:hypothetical protein
MRLYSNRETAAGLRNPRLRGGQGRSDPNRPNLGGDNAQVVPEINGGGAPPEPIDVVDAVNPQARFEYQRAGNHWIVFGIGVLLNVEVLLDCPFGIGQEGPLRADRNAKLLERVVVVGGDCHDLGVADCNLRIERGEIQVLLVLLRAIVAAR